MLWERSLNLTPGESLLLKDPELVRPGDLLKVTFADLLLKNAIKAEVREKKFFFLTQKEIYVSAGESFSKIGFKFHERVILDHITISGKKLNDVARELHSTLKTSNRYRDLYLRDPLMHKGYFRIKRKSFLGLFPREKYVLTEKGREAQGRIWSLLLQAKYLERWAEEDPARAKAYLSVCGANILLLPPKDLEMVKMLGKELEKIEAKTDSYYDYYWYDYAWRNNLVGDLEQNIDLDFIDFDLPDFNIIDSFDSIGSSFDGGFGGDGGGDGGGGDGGG